MSTENSHQQLAIILSADFRTDEKKSLARRGQEFDTEGGMSLSTLLSRVVVQETKAERSVSPENEFLANKVRALLTTAPITNSFKEHVVRLVIDAHAGESQVPTSISPSKLGISGDETGIYDPDKSKALEGRFLRQYVFNLVSGSLIRIGEGQEEFLFSLNPEIGQQFTEIEKWAIDYAEFYKEHPFGDKLVDISWIRKAQKIDPDSWRNFSDWLEDNSEDSEL